MIPSMCRPLAPTPRPHRRAKACGVSSRRSLGGIMDNYAPRLVGTSGKERADPHKQRARQCLAAYFSVWYPKRKARGRYFLDVHALYPPPISVLGLRRPHATGRSDAGEVANLSPTRLTRRRGSTRRFYALPCVIPSLALERLTRRFRRLPCALPFGCVCVSAAEDMKGREGRDRDGAYLVGGRDNSTCHSPICSRFVPRLPVRFAMSSLHPVGHPPNG